MSLPESRPCRASALFMLLATALLALAGALGARPTSTIVVNDTKEVALGSPRVHVLLRRDKAIVTARDGSAGSGGPANSFLACLDTGAGMHIVSKATADRFGLNIRRDTLHVLFGIHGPVQVGASPPHDLAIAGAAGGLDGRAPGRYHLAHRDASLVVAREEPPLIISEFDDFNLIGMPAIRKWIIEMDPAPMCGVEGLFGGGPAIRFLEDHESVPDNADVRVSLEYFDFNEHRQFEIPSPRPMLAPRLMFPNVLSQHRHSTLRCRWLFDTGASTSVISIRHAQSLGLYRHDGTPVRPPDFTLRLCGIEGRVLPTPGYVLDRISIPARDGKILEFRHVHVVVRDVGATEENGRVIVLDGIFGMNLLLPGASGIQSLDEDETVGRNRPGVSFNQGAFERIWIDGPRGMLALRLRK